MPAFKKPEAKNASTTLVAMAALLTTMFLGTSVLAYLYGVHPHESETVISQFARVIFTGPIAWFYFVVQAATAGGKLTLTWTPEPGIGGPGRGCQVCEVWVLKKPGGK